MLNSSKHQQYNQSTFDDKKSNGDVPYNQINNINISSKKLNTEQVGRN
jgi:hypothetical protein